MLRKGLVIWLLFPIFALATTEPEVKVNGYILIVRFNEKDSQIEVRHGSRILYSQNLDRQKDPKVKKLESFSTNRKNYVLLDYKIGHEFGSMYEKTCDKVILWQISEKGSLKHLQEEVYNCDVNSSEEYFLNQEFYHPYSLNKAIPRLEFK